MTEETIFAAALELPPADRADYLAKACGEDAALPSGWRGPLPAIGPAGSWRGPPS